jgi:malonyl CoA-acyl carrier protein transacylase
MRALVICPGRGSYRREQLGSLKDRSAEARAVIEACDAHRAAQGLPTVSELDAAEAFSSRRHLAGENASLLTFAAGMADLAELADTYEIVGVTGNSMGWYTALAASGALPLADAIRLVDTMGTWQTGNVQGGQLLYPLADADWEHDPAREAAIEQALAATREAGHGAWWSIRLGSFAVLGADADGLGVLAAALPEDKRGARTFPTRLPMHSAFHTPVMTATSERAQASLSDLAWQAPRVPLVDGRGLVHRPIWADPVELEDWTLGAQVTDVYDYTTAVHAALYHCAPDVVVLLGPGNSLGAPTAATLVQKRWFGIRDKAQFQAVQADAPVLLSFGVEEQAARLRG